MIFFCSSDISKSTFSVGLSCNSCERLNAESVVLFAVSISARSRFSLRFICSVNLFVISLIFFIDSRSFSIIEAMISELFRTSGRSFSSMSATVDFGSHVSLPISSRVLSMFAILLEITFAFAFTSVLFHRAIVYFIYFVMWILYWSCKDIKISYSFWFMSAISFMLM